jgi:hypothetical protein
LPFLLVVEVESEGWLISGSHDFYWQLGCVILSEKRIYESCPFDAPSQRCVYPGLRMADHRIACATLFFRNRVFRKRTFICLMLLSKEYVGYLAREVTKKLISGEFIETKAVPAVTEKVHAAILEELSLEDRINDEVRVILEAYSDEMNKSGANYQEMFRKVKSELVRKYKAVL